jgi:enoyl-CoA hydratase
MAALLVKESVNQSVDAMGFNTALNACFAQHQLNHSHWMELSRGRTAVRTTEFGMPDWRTSPAIEPARMRSP